MSYAIGRLIYGVPGNERLTRALKDFWGDEYDTTMERWGFEHLYEGTAPWYFGVRLDEIDETETVDLVEFLERNLTVFPMASGAERFQPGIDFKTLYNQKLKELPDDIRRVMPLPKLLIVWESS